MMANGGRQLRRWWQQRAEAATQAEVEALAAARKACPYRAESGRGRMR